MEPCKFEVSEDLFEMDFFQSFYCFELDKNQPFYDQIGAQAKPDVPALVIRRNRHFALNG